MVVEGGTKKTSRLKRRLRLIGQTARQARKKIGVIEQNLPNGY